VNSAESTTSLSSADAIETTADGGVPEANLSSLEPAADAFVRDGEYAETSYGSEPVLVVETARAGLNRISYLKFDISQISSTIQSAKLRIYARVDRDASLETELFAVPDESWTEEALSWNNHPGVSVSLGKVLVEGSEYKIYEVDLSDYIKQAKAAGSQSVSIAFSNPASSTEQIQMSSREAGSNAPELVIQTSN
jgi:hyaluronate lyase